MAMGGTETMIMRLLSWYSSKGYRAILLTLKEIDSKSISNDLNNIDFEHYIYNLKNKQFFTTKGTLLSFDKNESVWVNTQYFKEFLVCYTLLKKSKYNCYFIHNIFIVHPYSTHLFGRKFNFLGKKLVKILLTNRNLVFMDEPSVESCIDFYKLDKNNFKFDIFRLPFHVSIDKADIEIKRESNIFNILTISRFDFPFKGYVLGLINSFASTCINYGGELSMTIIGYGNDKIMVDKLIKSLPINISSKINVLDEVPYSKIKEHIEKCSLFVGMGTTILDAANLNKIVIVPVSYQNLNLSTGFFHENYKILGEIYKKDTVYKTFDNLILEVLNYSKEDFKQISIKSKSVLREHYDINFIADDLFNYTKKAHYWIDFQMISIIGNLHLLLKYIHKKMNKY